MFPEPWSRFKELLDEALELPVQQRGPWLAGLSEADRPHRAELEEWISLEGGARGFLEKPLTPGATWERESTLPLGPGDTIDGYLIRRVLGFGGTSVVYEAEQDDPQRAVALKVFQADLVGEERRRRFTDEARILGELDHPAVAGVFAAGTRGRDSRSQAWIAMELIQGARTVTRYAEEEGLDLAQRLVLFAHLCDGVAHGHQRGIIHRDLKPANLLVDGGGRPRVIDFGVAKVLGSGPGGAGSTRTGSLVGTLAWMSPEQLGGDPAAVDTRSDVYSLGVVLYELVCGELPHDFEGDSFGAALRRIREAPVPVPRAKVRGLSRDLESILLTALAKGPDERYATAADLAADLRRFLDREPVVARPPSVLHHLRLYAARHRRRVAGVSLVVLALAAALGFGSLRASRIRAAEHEKAAAITDFLTSILAFGSPSHSPRGDLTMREVLDDASRRIELDLASAPGARAEIHAMVGSAWRELGDLPRAEEHLRSATDALRLSHPGSWELAGALSILSEVLLAAERGPEAEAVLVEARGIYASLPGTPEFFHGIVTNKLASAYRLQGDLPRAEEHATEALAIYRRSFGDVHVAVASAHETLAAIQLEAGRLGDAERNAREALRQHRATAGDDSLAVAQAQLGLAEVLGASDGKAGARSAAEAALPVLSRLLPEGHPDRLRAVELLGSMD